MLTRTAQSDAPTAHSLDDLPGATLIYISDYFSFIGQDHQGYVAFALDNSRGRDGDTYQAEHLVLLHDDQQCWESFILMPNVNRLTHTYWDMWNEYQGFYLRTGLDGDLCFRSQKSERLAPSMGFRDGFIALNSETDMMKDMNVEVLGRELAWGFYRWPTSWRVTWIGPKGPAVVFLKQLSRTSIGNWAVGGFSMAVVTGELEYGGEKRPLYGLVELIM